MACETNLADVRIWGSTAIEHELEKVVHPRVLLRELVPHQDADELSNGRAHRLLRFREQRLRHALFDVLLDVFRDQLPVAEFGEPTTEQHEGVLSDLEVGRVHSHVA